MQNPDLAAWLVAHRAEIEQTLESRLGPAAPRAGADETEVLRRFRSYASLALHRGSIAQPALDGLRVNERRVTALLGAWSDAASEVAGARPWRRCWFASRPRCARRPPVVPRAASLAPGAAP
jgi:hypothetical protein